MLGSVLAKTLREQRRALAWWAVGLVAACVVTTSFYPSVAKSADQLSELLDSLPEGLRNAFLGGAVDFASPEGYLQGRLFALFVPLLLLIYAIGAGARAIAGEEERLTLDLLLSTPVTRRRVLLDKAAALLIASVGLAVVLWLAIAISGPPFDVIVPVDRLAAAILTAFLLATAFGAIALAVGSGTGHRGLAVGVASGAAATTYLIDVLALSVDGLGWLQRLSPFYYYRSSQPLTSGLQPFDALVLAAIAVVGIVVAVVAFERRDLAS
jgi:ABC-2 type transport system permease protein